MTDPGAAAGRPACTARPGCPKVILGDSVFLAVMGVFGFSQDILSYGLGAGRFGAFLFEDPRALGFVEAHGLAAAIAAAAFVHARRSPLFWHAFLGLVHAFLGSCNLAFFGLFVATGDVRFAAIVTAAHFALAALHAAAMARPAPRPRPPTG